MPVVPKSTKAIGGITLVINSDGSGTLTIAPNAPITLTAQNVRDLEQAHIETALGRSTKQ